MKELSPFVLVPICKGKMDYPGITFRVCICSGTNWSQMQ